MQCLQRISFIRKSPYSTHYCGIGPRKSGKQKGGKNQAAADAKLQELVEAIRWSTPLPKPKITEEQAKYQHDLVKIRSKIRFKQHLSFNKDIRTKLRLSKEAITALPERFKEAALTPDRTLFPYDRWIASGDVPPTFPTNKPPPTFFPQRFGKPEYVVPYGRAPLDMSKIDLGQQEGASKEKKKKVKK